MILSDAIDLIQTVLAVGAFVLAYSEFKKWRHELLGSKRIEIAIQLGKVAIEIREAFKSARSPFSFNSKAPEHEPDSSPDEKLKKDQEHDFNQRLQKVSEQLEKIYELRWEVQVLFGQDINEEVKRYNAKFHELQAAMLRIHRNKGSDEDIDLVFSTSKDEFSEEVEDVTTKLFDFARRYTR